MKSLFNSFQSFSLRGEYQFLVFNNFEVKNNARGLAITDKSFSPKRLVKQMSLLSIIQYLNED